MRKTFLTAVAWLLAAVAAVSAPIGLKKAKAIASERDKATATANRVRQAGELQLAEVRTATASGLDDYPLYYVFNRSSDAGFIIVAGDDRMKPVLAEVDHGTFDADTDNPGFRWWLDAVAESAERIAQSDDESLLYTQSELTSSVEPLITTTWGQDKPYNNQCPEIDGKHCVTGCVATAMAQIFKYLEYPNTVNGGEISYDYTINYSDGTTRKMDIGGDLSEFSFDYELMNNSYETDDTGDAADEVAELMYACGLASNMQYDTNESSSYIKYKVLTENFGLDKTCKWAQRSDYSTDDWQELIRSELDAKRPVLYGGQDSSGGGHQFICDGYDSEGKFHINWGWAGYQDGYFDLSMNGYSEGQDIVYNLMEDEGGTADALSYLTFNSIGIYQQKLPITVGLGNNLGVMCYTISANWIDFNGYEGFALYKDGTGSNSNLYQPESLSAGLSRSYFGFSFSFPADLEGVYTLRPVAGLTTSEYEQVSQAKSSDGSKYLVVAVNDGKAIISDCCKSVSTVSGYSSFSSPCAVTVPEGVTVYKAKMGENNNTIVLTATDASVIPANTGALLYSEGGGKFHFEITDEELTDDFSDNELIATTDNPTVPNSGTYYALVADKAEFGVLTNGLELSSGKAYIKASDDSGAKTLPFVFGEGGANGISDINGIATKGDGAFYTPQGIRVERPSKGLYIHNGKKIVIK